MDKHRAIPQGYMTVGALAKRMNTTVRTLQYYDKEGLLSPSAVTLIAYYCKMGFCHCVPPFFLVKWKHPGNINMSAGC